MAKAWFTDSSSTTNETKTNESGKPINQGWNGQTEEGTIKSVQHYWLQDKQLGKQKENLYIRNSWCVFNGIAIWSSKWKTTKWQINGKVILSWEA